MKRVQILVVALVAAIVIAAVWWYRASSGADRKDIVLVVVDTMGAKHLSLFGGCEGCPPTIEAFANKGVAFKRAYATSPWTKPSMASIFTGLYARGHGVQRMENTLSESVLTMAEWLSAQGYETAGVISQGLIERKHGYAQGFDHYESVTGGKSLHDAITSSDVTDRALELVKNRDPKKPLFLFVHYFDPHSNYRHHEQFNRTSEYKGQLVENMTLRELRKKLKELNDDDIAYIRDLYREEIEYTDQQINRLISGLTTPAMLFLTADHGEEFNEHGYLGHGRSLFDELVNVPLVIVPNIKAEGGSAPKIVESTVSIADIFPTVIEVVAGGDRMASLPEIDGSSLVPFLLKGSTETPGRLVYTDVNHTHTRLSAVIRDNLKLVYHSKAKGYRLYDLKADRTEKTRLPIDESDALIMGMREALDTHRNQEARQADKIKHTSEEINQLKTLGYLQ